MVLEEYMYTKHERNYFEITMENIAFVLIGVLNIKISVSLSWLFYCVGIRCGTDTFTPNERVLFSCDKSNLDVILIYNFSIARSKAFIRRRTPGKLLIQLFL